MGITHLSLNRELTTDVYCRAAKMPPKKKTAAGYRMAAPQPAGTVLTDLAKRRWRLGATVGSGGFGALYTATEQGGEGRVCVAKIEPHENGP